MSNSTPARKLPYIPPAPKPHTRAATKKRQEAIFNAQQATQQKTSTQQSAPRTTPQQETPSTHQHSPELVTQQCNNAVTPTPTFTFAQPTDISGATPSSVSTSKGTETTNSIGNDGTGEDLTVHTVNPHPTPNTNPNPENPNP